MTDTVTAPTRWGYQFDPVTGEYIGPVRLFADVLAGTWPLPADVVAFAPTEAAGPHEHYRLNAARDGWERVADFRGLRLFAIATGQLVANTLALGEAVPDTLTLDAPTMYPYDACLVDVWDAGARRWKAVPDYSRHPLWDTQTVQLAEAPPRGEPLPAHVTPIEPPHGVHRIGQWDADAGQWKAVDDYRGTHYWTPGGEFVQISAVGIKPPADALDAPPAKPGPAY